MSAETYSRPSEVLTSEGRVLIDGPDHVDFALTPDAAEETGRRLILAAEKARREQLDADSSSEIIG